MAEPAYPSSGEFVPKHQRNITARQFDGSDGTAYEILAWVYRNGGKGQLKDGYESQGPDLLYVNPIEAPVLENDWVIKTADGTFDVMTDKKFREVYEPAPLGGLSRG